MRPPAPKPSKRDHWIASKKKLSELRLKYAMVKIQYGRELKKCMKLNKQFDTELIHIEKENNAAGRMLEQLTLNAKEARDEEEKWKDIRVGANDEFDIEVKALEKLDLDNDKEWKELSTQIRNDTQCMREMHCFFKSNECMGNATSLDSEIAAQRGEKDSLSRSLQSLKDEFRQVTVAKERKAEKERRYPNETERQFLLKETRKLRHDTAMKLNQVRLQCRQQSVETSDQPNTVASNNHSNDVANLDDSGGSSPLI